MIKTLKPAGHRVVVKPDEIEKVSKGGIILETTENVRKNSAQVTGELVSVGPTAWKDFSTGEPWAKKGDRVLYAKYAGYEIKVDGVLHRVMNDEDITAIVTEMPEEAK